MTSAMSEETNTCRWTGSTAMSPNPFGSSVPAASTGGAATTLVQAARSATSTANNLNRDDIDGQNPIPAPGGGPYQGSIMFPQSPATPPKRSDRFSTQPATN